MNAEYKTPEDMLQEANQEMDTVSNDLLFNGADKKYKDMQEKWQAAVFGLGYQKYIAKCMVRMNPEQNSSVDFFLRINSEEYPFQLTMKMKHDENGGKRLLGAEYKNRAKTPMLLIPYRPGYNSSKAADWIFDAVQNKISNHTYSNSKELNLLVYANFETNGIDRKNIVEKLEQFKTKFSSIWIITNHGITSIYVNNDLREILIFKTIPEILPPVFQAAGPCKGQPKLQPFRSREESGRSEAGG